MLNNNQWADILKRRLNKIIITFQWVLKNYLNKNFLRSRILTYLVDHLANGTNKVLMPAFTERSQGFKSNQLQTSTGKKCRQPSNSSKNRRLIITETSCVERLRPSRVVRVFHPDQVWIVHFRNRSQNSLKNNFPVFSLSPKKLKLEMKNFLNFENMF